MFDKNYFLNQLRNGASIDAIGQSIADAMNEAVEAHNAEVAAAEAEAAKAAAAKAAVENKKYELAKEMIHIIQEYGMIVAPNAKEIMDQVTEEDLNVMIQTLDEMFHMMTSMIELKNKLEGASIPTSKSDDDVLANFIASLM